MKKWKMEKISSPLQPDCVRLPKPIGKNKRRWVLTEAAFQEFVLKRGLSKRQLHSDFGLSQHIYETSKDLYRTKYAQELRALKHKRYSLALKGNTHGAKEHPAVLVDRKKLSAAVASGKKLSVLADEFGVSEWFLRANVKYYGLEKDGELPYRMQRVDYEYLERLDFMTPGLLAAAKKFYDDPHKFYLHLYDAFCKLSEMTLFIKDQAKGHAYYRIKGTIPKDHICWSSNQYEMKLSRTLTDAGITHTRQFCFFKKYMADFAFPGSKLLVEIDGGYHEQKEIQDRDRHKEAKARELGFSVLRFSTSQVVKDSSWVLNQIEKSLREEFQVSSLLAKEGSGTSQ